MVSPTPYLGHGYIKLPAGTYILMSFRWSTWGDAHYIFGYTAINKYIQPFYTEKLHTQHLQLSPTMISQIISNYVSNYIQLNPIIWRPQPCRVYRRMCEVRCACQANGQRPGIRLVSHEARLTMVDEWSVVMAKWWLISMVDWCCIYCQHLPKKPIWLRMMIDEGILVALVQNRNGSS